MATGYAIGRGEPALALLHTTAGLGNAVGAIATARVNRAPLVIVVGQQDRRHLVFEPFLAGRLARARRRVPGPVRPARARRGRPRGDRPCLARGGARRGPAIVVVPMDDWLQPADDDREDASPDRVVRAAADGRCRGRGARGVPRGGVVAGARRRRRRGRRGVVGGPGRAGRATRRAGLPGVVRRPRRLPAGPPPLRGLPPGRPDPAARAARAVRRRARRRRARVPAVAVGGGPAHRGRDEDRGRRRRPGRGAAEPGRARRAGAAGGGRAGARPPGAAARRGAARAVRAAARARIRRPRESR